MSDLDLDVVRELIDRVKLGPATTLSVSEIEIERCAESGSDAYVGILLGMRRPVRFCSSCRNYSVMPEDAEQWGLWQKNVKPPSDRRHEAEGNDEKLRRPALRWRNDGGSAYIEFHDGLSGRVIWQKSRWGTYHRLHWIDFCGIHSVLYAPPTEAEFDVEWLVAVEAPEDE